MILIIDDDSAVRSSLSFMLKRAGYEVKTAPGPREAMDIVRAEAPALILMDMNFTLSTTGEEGLTLLKQVKVFRPDVPVILMTAWGSIQLAVQGMQAGAFDFITKPWNNAALLQRIETALELTAAPKEVPEEQTTALNRSHIIGKSKGLMEVLNTVARIARTNASVLITGESGTGKEVLANFVHQNSLRRDKPFIPINCAAIPAELMEAEFFGYEKGAFTGANREGKAGLFEMADNGTIFLDELGEMPLSLQSKLLRVLESGEVKRIGSSKTIKTNVRIIAATNRNLNKMVEENTFREDLYYRLNVIPIKIPPLRERPEDIEALSEHFLREYNRKYGRNITLSNDVMKKFKKYPWPGNIRELRNEIERYVITEGKLRFDMETDSLPEKKNNTPEISDDGRNVVFKGYIGPLKDVMSRYEMEYIKSVIKECGGVMTEAAKRLGIHRSALYKKLEKFDEIENKQS